MLKMDKSVKRDLCILILQYNSSDLTMQLLESMVLHEGGNLRNYSVIVMDNASEEPMEREITRKYKFVRFVQYSENLGFAKAHNRIMDEVAEEWVLLLNNDCILLNDAISRTLERTKEKKADFSTCCLYNEDGTFQINFSTSPAPLKKFLLNLTGFNRHVLQKLRTKKKICSVGYVNGAFLLLKRKSIPKPKLFDDRYFMYTEDLDLMIRMEKNGRKGIRISDGKVIHLGGASAKREWGDERRSDIKWEQEKECMARYYPQWLVALWINIKEFVGR